jgi:two-component sensor histidine kinase
MHQASRILPLTGGSSTAVTAPTRAAWPDGLRLLLLGSLVVPALVLLLWGERSWRLEWARAADVAERNARLVSEYIRGAIDTQRAVLDHVGTLSANVERGTSEADALHARLTEFNDRLSGVLRLAVFDADGALVASSRRQPPGLSIAARDYFQVLRDGGPQPRVDRIRLQPDGQDVVLIATRRPGAEFRGVLVSTVPVTTFTDFFGRIAADPRAAASLIRADGRLLVRHRPDAAPMELPADAPSRAAMERGDGGVYEAHAVSDRTWRLYSVSRVGDLPLFGSFGVPRDAILGAWLHGMALVGALLLLTALASGVGVLSAARRLRLAADRAELAEAQRRADMQATLLRELHHRVKNSLMTVQSLIRMQGGGPEATRTLQGRVIALAQVHDLLHVSGMASRLELSDFIRTLCARTALAAPGDRIDIRLDLQPVEVGVEAAGPLALIVVELLGNAVRHAFPRGRPGRVTIALRAEDGEGVLSIRDDGVGLPDGVTRRRHAGLGLVERLVAQLRGRLELRVAGGTEAVVAFPLRAEPASMAA